MRNDGDNTYLHFNGTQEEFEELKQALHKDAKEMRLLNSRFDVYVMSARGRPLGLRFPSQSGDRDYYEEVCSVEPPQNNGPGEEFIKLILPTIEAYFAKKYVGNSDAILDISRCYERNPFMPDEMGPPVESYSIYAARMEIDADDRPVLRRLVNEIAPDAEERTVL